MILKSTQKKVKEINNKLIVIKKIFNKTQKNIKKMIRIQQHLQVKAKNNNKTLLFLI